MFLDGSLADRAREPAVLELLRRDEHLERDAFLWMKPISGHSEIEHGAADLDRDEQPCFWTELSGCFTQDAELRLVHADALLLAGERPCLEGRSTKTTPSWSKS